MIVPIWAARKELNDEARLLGAKSGNRGLNLGIATYSRGNRLDARHAAQRAAGRRYRPAAAVE